MKLDFVYDDGGRALSGRRGYTGDCVCRAICIATGKPYKEVYDFLAENNAKQRTSRRTPKGSRTASKGINVRRKWFQKYMHDLGFTWIPTMGIGTGCRVHLLKEELPNGRLVVALSKHYTAVIDGVIHDTYNPCRADENGCAGSWIKFENGIETRGTIGERCVYGYYQLNTLNKDL